MDQKEIIDDSESIASDESEEMTEVDEDEFDLRRAECMADMKEIECQFMKLKEELIKERFVIIEQKAKEIEEETAEEFTIPLSKLKQSHDIKLKLSTLTFEYKMKNINHIHDYEVDSQRLTFKNNKQAIFDKLKENIQKEIQQVEESHRRFLLDCNYYLICKNGSSLQEATNQKDSITENSNVNRQATSHSKIYEQVQPNNDKIPAPKILTGTPYMVYSLQDYEILEDLSIIKMHDNLSRSISTEC